MYIFKYPFINKQSVLTWFNSKTCYQHIRNNGLGDSEKQYTSNEFQYFLASLGISDTFSAVWGTMRNTKTTDEQDDNDKINF